MRIDLLGKLAAGSCAWPSITNEPASSRAAPAAIVFITCILVSSGLHSLVIGPGPRVVPGFFRQARSGGRDHGERALIGHPCFGRAPCDQLVAALLVGVCGRAARAQLLLRSEAA